jgi:ABC-2 type transport system permease protein
MMFRANFLVRSVTHLIWLGVMLVFVKVIFLHTRRIGNWDQFGLLFFMGTYLTLNATVNCLFINGCSRFSELVRTGNLDFELLKPVDEQFLLTCQRIDWALAPQILLGLALSAFARYQSGSLPSVLQTVSYLLLLAGGVAILYSLLVVLAATSVWTVRHEEMYELWFHALQFANYPDDIYRKSAAGMWVGFVLTYLLPILVAVNVPARYGAMLLDRWQPVAWLGVSAILALLGNRWFFRFALRSYQSASS